MIGIEIEVNHDTLEHLKYKGAIFLKFHKNNPIFDKMKFFLTIVNGIMAVGVVDPNIVNGNGPGGNECPNNSCYEIDDIGVCNAKESCFRVTCTKLGTGIQFKVRNEN